MLWAMSVKRNANDNISLVEKSRSSNQKGERRHLTGDELSCGFFFHCKFRA